MKIILDSVVETQYGEEFFLSIADRIAEFAKFEINSELSVLLTDDETMRGINGATDVLSFPMREDSMLGDIVISLESAERQALEFGITLDREVAFLFIHGFLHLLGFDHEDSAEDENKMYDLQEDILRMWETGRL